MDHQELCLTRAGCVELKKKTEKMSISEHQAVILMPFGEVHYGVSTVPFHHRNQTIPCNYSLLLRQDKFTFKSLHELQCFELCLPKSSTIPREFIWNDIGAGICFSFAGMFEQGHDAVAMCSATVFPCREQTSSLPSPTNRKSRSLFGFCLENRHSEEPRDVWSSGTA